MDLSRRVSAASSSASGELRTASAGLSHNGRMYPLWEFFLGACGDPTIAHDSLFVSGSWSTTVSSTDSGRGSVPSSRDMWKFTFVVSVTFMPGFQWVPARLSNNVLCFRDVDVVSQAPCYF